MNTQQTAEERYPTVSGIEQWEVNARRFAFVAGYEACQQAEVNKLVEILKMVKNYDRGYDWLHHKVRDRVEEALHHLKQNRNE